MYCDGVILIYWQQLLEEYGLDFRFLLDKLLSEDSQNTEKPNPPAYKTHAQQQQHTDPMRTPAPTPNSSRARSPAPTLVVPVPTRGVRPPPPVPPLPPSPANGLLPAPIPSPGNTPYPRTSSPASSLTPHSYSTLPSPRLSTRSLTPEVVPRVTGPRMIPPRSMNRPGSGATSRPPPVAIPRRDNMF